MAVTTVVVVNEVVHVVTSGTQGPAGAPGATGPAGPAGGEDMPYNREIDSNADGSLIYIGEADPGTATSAALWRIKKIVFTDGGGDASITWADGNENFDNVYDNRASLSYS